MVFWFPSPHISRSTYRTKKMRLFLQTTARDEAHLAEWLTHHFVNFDFTAACVYDDQSDGPMLSELKKKLPSDLLAKTTVIDVEPAKTSNFNLHIRGLVHFSEKVLPVWVAQKLADDDDWVFVTDCDEFLYVPPGLTPEKLFVDADQVFLPWLFYGHSFRINDDPDALILEQYERHAGRLSAIHKSCCRVGALLRASQDGLFSQDIHTPLRSDLVRSRDIPSELPQDTPHLAHFSKLSIKNFFWRKSARVSPTRGSFLTSNLILKMLLWSDADNEASLGLMRSYVPNLKKVLPWVPVTPLLEDPEDLVDCALYCPSLPEPVVIFRPHADTFNRRTLFQILCCPGLRFCRRDELLPADFEAREYLALNTDLTGLSERSLENHFVCAGKAEGRAWTAPPLPEDFDPETYAELNLDLQNLPVDYLKAHWRLHGEREGRSYARST